MPFTVGQYLSKNDLNSQEAAHTLGYGVVNGLQVVPDAPPSMDIDVEIGKCYAANTLVEKGAVTTLTVTAADPANPRKDIVVCNSVGTLSIVAGTPEAALPSANVGVYTLNPEPPSIPANSIILAEIWVPAAAASITGAEIYDKRVIIADLKADAVSAVEAAGLALASGMNIGILSALTADQTWSGLTASLVAGENLTIGQAVYMKNDGRVWKSDANQVTTMPVVALATATIAVGNAGIFLLIGFFREDSVFNFGVAGLLYASAAATGALTTTAPAGSGDQVQVCGQCFPSAHVIYFNPSLELVEIS